MTTLIQLPNTPEIFAKVERRLAEAIHEQAKMLARFHERDLTATEVQMLVEEEIESPKSAVNELRGLHQALKRDLPVHVDAAFYWSLTNETATTQKPEIA